MRNASLIEERLGSLEGFFRLNPSVEDIPDRFSLEDGGVRLLVMGGVAQGGGGCACPQSAFLKSLLQHIVPERTDWVFIDCEAGLEHLGRATATGADALLVVVEPSHSSLETAQHLRKLAADIELSCLYAVGKKVRDREEGELIEGEMAGLEILACLPESSVLRRASSRGMPERDPDIAAAVSGILTAIESKA